MFRNNARKLRALLAAIALACGTGLAHADIAAFNDAVRKGDYKAASAAAQAAWPALDKTAPDIAVIAGEFGFASLVAGEDEAAREFGKFLVEQGASLPTPDTKPATSAVLYRAADFRIGKSEAHLAALRQALHGRMEAPGVDLISVISWELLYGSAMASGDMGNAETDAKAAAEFYGRLGDVYIGRQRSAEVVMLAANFMNNRVRSTTARNQLYDQMADLHDQIVADLKAAETPADRNALWPSKWKAQAWALAIGAFLDSTYSQIGSNINKGLKQRPLAHPGFMPVEEDRATISLPICEGKFEGKNLVYPANREFAGMVGSVVARLETAANGKVTGVEILASVPFEGFKKTVSDTMSTWTYKPARNARTSACRLNSRNHIYSVQFRMG